MGYRKPMDYNSVNHQIWMLGVELNDSRNDGWTQWELKKDLYKLQALISDILEKSPKFADEEEFLKEMEQQRVVNVLSK